MYGLLAYLPVSGLAIIASYPDTQAAVLVKDLVFILPAYLAFMTARSRIGWSFPGAPVLPMAAFAALVALMMLPLLGRPLVPLIGAKVWLFCQSGLKFGLRVATYLVIRSNKGPIGSSAPTPP